jgi:tripartite-type tricarboxylate transporter receptor subunit TctC
MSAQAPAPIVACTGRLLTGSFVRRNRSMFDVRVSCRRLAAYSVALSAAMSTALAQAAEAAYPARPIRIVVASAAGSGSDIVARTLSTRLAENLGHAVVVDNRPGAAGLIGAEIVARATPDGYTMFIPTLTQHISTTLAKRHRLDAEFEPVGFLANTPFMIVTSASVPVKSMEEFIAYAKARPGKLLYGSSGNGGSLHICIELLQSMAGLRMTHVPYKGTAAVITDLMTNTVQLGCPPVAAMSAFMNNAKLRVLAVTTQEATSLAPGQPPVSAALPGYAFPGWYGALVPLRTPKAIVALLHKELARTLAAPDIRDRLLKQGVEPAMSSPEEFREFLSRESKRMEVLLKDAGVQAAQ